MNNAVPEKILITYIYQYHTNYGYKTMIIVAENTEEADKIALENGAWNTNDVSILHTDKKGCIYISD